jgi:hypothetical protein
MMKQLSVKQVNASAASQVIDGTSKTNQVQVHQSKKQTSSPIPIKAPTSTSTSTDNHSDTVRAQYYDRQTWGMYHRIANSRRKHAYTIQSSEHFDEYCLAQLNLLNVKHGEMKKTPPSQASVSSISSMDDDEEEENEGNHDLVFILEV